MAAELVWHVPHPDGNLQEVRAQYNTAAEALLQAAHNELVAPVPGQEIHDGDGKVTHNAKAIRAAAGKLKAHREAHGHAGGMLTVGADYDSATELEALK